MDKISKALQKLSREERKIVTEILYKIKSEKLNGCDIKKLKGRDNIFRIRKGRIRIIFLKVDDKVSILTIERRCDNTYNI